MLAGTVTDDGVPVIMLFVAGQMWPSIIDTGFNGDLELPESLRQSLHARFIGRSLFYSAVVRVLRKTSIWSIFRSMVGLSSWK
jgi:hypothetical protein